MTTQLEGQVQGLSYILQLSKRVRNAVSSEEVGFIAVNETKNLVDYRQAVLWVKGRGVAAVSGLPLPENNTPYTNWLSESFRIWAGTTTPRRISAADLPSELAQDWEEWLPMSALLCPLPVAEGRTAGLLLLARDAPWEEHDLALLAELTAIYGHGLRQFLPKHSWNEGVLALVGTTTRRLLLVTIALAFFFIPVRLSVLATAEVSPKEPYLVRSPLDGVIDRFLVQPNEKVSTGQLLFQLDKENLNAKLGIARKSYELATEEYRQSSQLALNDEKGRMEMAPRKGMMEEKAEELAYSRQMFNRVEVKAPKEGVAVFTDPNDWVGKAVALGERVLLIAEPSKVEILMRLPVADTIELKDGAQVTLFLTTQPERPYTGVLTYLSYRAEPLPTGVVAYTLKADFKEAGELPRIGLSGTARIYGKKVSLAYYIFRRPLTALRQRLAW